MIPSFFKSVKIPPANNASLFFIVLAIVLFMVLLHSGAFAQSAPNDTCVEVDGETVCFPDDNPPVAPTATATPMVSPLRHLCLDEFCSYMPIGAKQ